MLGLLAVALVVALVLWAMIRRDSGGEGATDDDRPPALNPLPPRRVLPEIASTPPTIPTATRRRTTTSPTSALADGDPSTTWRTVCYAAR